jgi:hypothetical protein
LGKTELQQDALSALLTFTAPVVTRNRTVLLTHSPHPEVTTIRIAYARMGGTDHRAGRAYSVRLGRGVPMGTRTPAQLIPSQFKEVTTKGTVSASQDTLEMTARRVPLAPLVHTRPIQVALVAPIALLTPTLRLQLQLPVVLVWAVLFTHVLPLGPTASEAVPVRRDTPAQTALSARLALRAPLRMKLDRQVVLAVR